jgi:hypothetical protein
MILHTLVLGYHTVGDTAAAHRTQQILTQVGNPEQRLQSGFHLLEQDLDKLTYQQALARFDRLLHPGQPQGLHLSGTGQNPGNRLATVTGPVVGDTTNNNPITPVTKNQSVPNTGVNWQMTSTTASDTMQVAGLAAAGVQKAKNGKTQQTNGPFISRNLPLLLQSEAAFIHWRITSKRSDRGEILAEGETYLKNYPDSPYAKWIGAKVKHMQAQGGGK